MHSALHWIFWLLSLCLNFQTAQTRINLTTIAYHYALEGDLEIQWKLNDTNGSAETYVVELWLINNTLALQNHSVCAQLISTDVNTEGSIRFPCGCFFAPGQYEIVAKDSASEDLSHHLELTVGWPRILLKVPSSFQALTESLTIGIELSKSQKLCEPLLSSFTTSIKVLLLDPTVGDKKFSELLTLPIPQLWTLNSTVLPCDVFDRTGQYKFQLITNWSDTVIAESDSMTVSWASDIYSLQMRTVSIFPCVGLSGIVISYTRPKCKSDKDRVRLYAIARVPQNSIEKPRKTIYIGEERVTTDKGNVQFSCDNFDLFYPGYCFTYVTLASTGAVKRHLTQCIPTEVKVLPTDGNWSQWELWGGCTNSCDRGVKHRSRKCDSPKPKYGGRFCEGPNVETQDCLMPDCPNVTVVDMETFVTRKPQKCECGCNMSTLEAPLIVTSKICTNISTWVITAPTGHHVAITFISFGLKQNDFEWLKIRDGNSPLDNLIFRSECGDESSTEASANADKMLISPERLVVVKTKRHVAKRHKWTVSSGNSLRIEYFYDQKVVPKSTETPDSIDDESSDITVIQYRFIGEDEYEVITGRKILITSHGFWLQFLIICCIGLIFLTALIVAAVSFYYYTKRRLKRKSGLLAHQDDNGDMCTSVTSGNNTGFDQLKCHNNRMSTGSDHYSKTDLKYNRISLTDTDSSSGCDTLKRQMISPTHTNTNESGKPHEVSPLLPLSTSSPVDYKVRTDPLRRSSGGGKLPKIPEISNDDNSDVQMVDSLISPSPTVSRIKVKKFKSIGVQLNSPALSGHRSIVRPGISTTSLGPTRSNCDSPSPSWAGTDQDFEYDYYEPNVPGSFLIPPNNPIGWVDEDINIDDILVDAELLMKTPTPSNRAESELNLTGSSETDVNSVVCHV